MDPDESVPLDRIVEVVEGHGQTLTLFNADLSQDEEELIAAHFDVTTVAVEFGRTDTGQPRSFAVLHGEDGFVAACAIDDLIDAIDPAGPLLDADAIESDATDLLGAIDQSVFTDYGKRQLVLASRQVERAAWRARPTTLHVGFQQFSNLRTQVDLYRRLTEHVEVHLYGVPDWEPPLAVEPHGHRDPELERSWFVVLDDDRATAGTTLLLATQDGPDTFSGFWMSKDSIVERTLDRLRDRFPANAPFGTGD
ncbi:DICT sensory domain-containing protein [Halococcoides cellulosivorans]|uniref:DICT domain-containing protein n=1 Tax=Halococcoides cellulosivorans TaxID=1679096 RepID=A0A2R4X2W7_9EURY|nr:DICT sensory domain-containing protein [Halococcoides cellulosivorans]AWB28124.1 hypothetical protein HARCEL1_10610 [Halococcoides cellulosivorans]